MPSTTTSVRGTPRGRVSIDGAPGPGYSSTAGAAGSPSARSAAGSSSKRRPTSSSDPSSVRCAMRAEPIGMFRSRGCCRIDARARPEQAQRAAPARPPSAAGSGDTRSGTCRSASGPATWRRVYQPRGRSHCTLRPVRLDLPGRGETRLFGRRTR
ncbi:MAG: hypothetical protein MZV63_06135 [Marinilabiliales bacterium]|nr:hypothetical protein [Marinilabiliales bacterium]